MGYLASVNKTNYVDAVIAGSAAASFSVEGFGGGGLLNCSKNMINDRISVIAKQLKHEGREYETK